MFKQDRIENEKKDPQEASSLKFINVPIILTALFVGFGATYIFLKTDDTSITEGDSRTVSPLAQEESSAAQAAVSKSAGEPNLTILMGKGKQVYTSTCQACHQANGEGIPGAFPPLAGSEWMSGSGKVAAAIVIHGMQGEITVKGEKYQSIMAPLGQQLSSEDIAAVLTYVRNSFGNEFDPVSVSLVDEVKEETKDRTGAWDGEAELKAKNWD